MTIPSSPDQCRGDPAAALHAFDESTAISRAIGNRRTELRTINNAGIVYGRTGDAAVTTGEAAFPEQILTGWTRRVTLCAVMVPPHAPTIPPCPRCHRSDGVEEEETTGSSGRWFQCRYCGNVWSAAPRSPSR